MYPAALIVYFIYAAVILLVSLALKSKFRCNITKLEGLVYFIVILKDVCNLFLIHSDDCCNYGIGSWQDLVPPDKILDLLDSWRRNRWVVPKCWYGITILRCVKSHKSTNLSQEFRNLKKKMKGFLQIRHEKGIWLLVNNYFIWQLLARLTCKILTCNGQCLRDEAQHFQHLLQMQWMKF